MGYKLTKEALLKDLYKAFKDAKRHKASKPYVKHFERNLDKELNSLCDDLWNRTYKAQPSRCFIINYPKKREVFAALFRDRVVHHLYFNYTHEMYERTFIQDTYSCIKKRGTFYGINRLAKHIRSESLNYKNQCWILNIDIRGYFMHINRSNLLNIITNIIRQMSTHRIHRKSSVLWRDVVDLEFVYWLTKEIVILDPTTCCIVSGRKEDWDGLDRNKSLFHAESGCGLPIGNLTSLLFSNVYLNVFDQFVKRKLKFKHYTRYVDDARIVCSSKSRLLKAIPVIRLFLKNVLLLDLHMGKLQIVNASYGSEFLGAFIKHKRMYVASKSLKRIKQNLSQINYNDKEKVWRSACSYLGMLKHYKSYNIRKALFMTNKFLDIAPFDEKLSKMEKPLGLSI